MKLNGAPTSTPAVEVKMATVPDPVPEAIQLNPDPMAPKLVEEPGFIDAPMPTVEDVIEDEEAEHFSLSLNSDDLKFVSDVENIEKELVVEDEADKVFYSPAVPGDRVLEQNIAAEPEAVAPVPVAPVSAEASGRSYLSKPEHIYVEANENAPVADAVPEVEEPVKAQFSVYEKPVAEANENVIEKKEELSVNALSSAYEEEEMQKRRQLERIQKLRNLSFNVNSNDPSDEFENVPAYVRRNMELKNNTSHVESYYSKFEVSSDDKNHGQINTINTFLDGKKPD